MNGMIDTRTTVRDYIIDTFLFGDASLMPGDDQSLLQNGIVDSTGVLDLILLVEDKFGLRVADEDVTPENFDSVDRISRFLERKRAIAA
jgi:acyl carrier protein